MFRTRSIIIHPVRIMNNAQNTSPVTTQVEYGGSGKAAAPQGSDEGEWIPTLGSLALAPLDLRLPAEFLLGLCGITQQGFNFGGSEITGIYLNNNISGLYMRHAAPSCKVIEKKFHVHADSNEVLHRVSWT